MTKSKSISIIGAGIGGLASAIMLARSGHQITIFEKFTETKPLGSGFLLQPPGQNILKSLGLYDAVKHESAETVALISKTPEGKCILDLHYSDLAGDAVSGLGVRRHVLHSALLDAAKAEGVRFILGADIQNLDENEGHVFDANGSHGPYDHIIIATGARDTLVDRYIKRTHNEYAWSCLWANVTLPASLPRDVLSQRVKTTRYMAGLSPIGPLSNDRVEAAFFWSLLHKNVDDWKNQSYERFRAEVATVWPEAADAIKPLTHDDFSHAIYYDVWCKKPWNGRIVALGDAIHGTSPQLGQGVTMALIDADVLAKMIDSDADCKDIYKGFWAARKNQLFFVRWTSRMLTPMFQSNSRILSWLRDFAFHFSTKISFIQKFALNTLASQKTNFFK